MPRTGAGPSAQDERLTTLLARMGSGPIAELPATANEKHYELPTGFFALMLGPRRNYSACLWEPDTTTLAQAEEKMLASTPGERGPRSA